LKRLQTAIAAAFLLAATVLIVRHLYQLACWVFLAGLAYFTIAALARLLGGKGP
jgi:hypothetical protein